MPEDVRVCIHHLDDCLWDSCSGGTCKYKETIQDPKLFGKPGDPVVSNSPRHENGIMDWTWWLAIGTVSVIELDHEPSEPPSYSYRLVDLRVSSEKRYSSPQEAATALEQRIKKISDQLTEEVSRS